MSTRIHSGLIAGVVDYLGNNLDSIAVATGAQPGVGSSTLTGIITSKPTTTSKTATSVTETVTFSESEANGAIRSIGLTGIAGLISSDALINKNASQSLTISIAVQVAQT
jgi:Ca2+/Na+ antiporter